MSFNDDGVRNHNQIQGVDEEGNLKNIKVTANGELVTASGGAKGQEEVSIKGITPTEDGKMPVALEDKITKTLMCDIATVGTEITSIEINKKVTRIELANYSENAKVTANIGNKSMKVGPNLIIEIIVNEDVATLELSSTEEGVEVQYLVEGEE